MKKCQKVPKSAKNYETILPFSCCPLVFPWIYRGLSKGVGRKGFPWFVLICSENKSEQIGRKRNKSEQIGVFPKTRSANRNKTGKSEQIGRNRGDPFLPTPKWGLRIYLMPKGAMQIHEEETNPPQKKVSKESFRAVPETFWRLFGVPGPEAPKNLLRLFYWNNLARQKITSKNKNNLARLFLCLF